MWVLVIAWKIPGPGWKGCRGGISTGVIKGLGPKRISGEATNSKTAWRVEACFRSVLIFPTLKDCGRIISQRPLSMRMGDSIFAQRAFMLDFKIVSCATSFIPALTRLAICWNTPPPWGKVTTTGRRSMPGLTGGKLLAGGASTGTVTFVFRDGTVPHPAAQKETRNIHI